MGYFICKEKGGERNIRGRSMPLKKVGITKTKRKTPRFLQYPDNLCKSENGFFFFFRFYTMLVRILFYPCQRSFYFITLQ